VKAVASAADVLRRPAPGLVVLIYHRVGRRTPIEVDLPLGVFEDQIGFLAEQCRVVTLEEGLRLPPAPGNTGDSVVAVTVEPVGGSRQPTSGRSSYDGGTAASSGWPARTSSR